MCVNLIEQQNDSRQMHGIAGTKGNGEADDRSTKNAVSPFGIPCCNPIRHWRATWRDLGCLIHLYNGR
jgi:hypothetical protein